MRYFRLVTICFVGMCFCSCLTTLLTVATVPDPVPSPAPKVVVAQPVQPTIYTSPRTTVTTIRPATGPATTTVVQINAATTDQCLYLDLQAVATAFAQSRTVEEFEMMLNSSRYMISNLDLNRDGCVDYLRVMEVISGYNHVYVIQAVLAANFFQNVATITLEMGYSTPYCQIIGEPYLYGANYIVQPVFIKTPPLYSPIRRAGYVAWQSPYYWGYYPSYYTRPAPQYLSHYQAYVHTYVHESHYCREVTYPTSVHYSSYNDVRRPVSRSDYQTQHPEGSFASRTSGITYTPTGSSQSRSVSNAADVRRVAEASTTSTSSRGSSASRGTTNSSTTSSTSSRSSSASSTSSTSASSSRTPATSSAGTTSATSSRSSSASSTSSTSASSSRTPATSSSTPSSSASRTATSAPATTTTTSRTTSTTTRVNGSGAIRKTTSTTQTTRSAGASSSSRSSSTPSRSTAAPASSSSSSRSGSSTRSSDTSSSSRSEASTNTRR